MLVDTPSSSRSLVVATWIFFFAGAVLTVLVLLVGIFYLTETGGFFDGMDYIQEHPYLLIYVELVSAGLIPLVYTIDNRDDIQKYGLTSKNLLTSSFVAIPLLVGLDLLEYLLADFAIFSTGESFGLSPVAGLWYAILGAIVYGPLEVFFVIWLVVKTDLLFDQSELISFTLGSSEFCMSKGSFITSFLFGLAHIVTTQNLPTFFYVFFIFLALTTIFENTGNAVGPMIAWTIYNNQVSYLILSSLS